MPQSKDQARGSKSGPLIPDPLHGGTQVEVATLGDVPDTAALTKWLEDKGIATSQWGKGDTKEVSKFWKELKLDEAGLELWRKADGGLQPIRVTHVLRAKVCSPESYERGIFLFNTWQQYGDGRTRTRNGLLSEKLCVTEMPLEDHLHEVCRRAVTEEEMQRVTESALKIGPGTAAPEFDPKYVCPLTVVNEKFVDHTIEIEVSKSYPGLMTMYHLYTVDIVCTGLPAVDFNTLEFGDEQGGTKPLKYIHAWVWLEWSQIQRYLLEGSTLKERKKKGSFKDVAQLTTWLGQFDLDLAKWGTGTYLCVDKLLAELEKEETHLELWGRHDGVPLLMRVVHVIQLKVGSTDFRQTRKFLFNTWQQMRDGQFRTVNRLMAKKVSTAQLPFNEEKFAEAAREAVSEELTYIVDVHFQMDPRRLPSPDDLKRSGVSVSWVAFEEHRVTVEESPSFRGMHTMYHLYTMEVECEGLPLADFSSLEFRPTSASSAPDSQELRYAHGWRWVTWQQVLDILQARTQTLGRNAEGDRQHWQRIRSNVQGGDDSLGSLTSALGRLNARVPANDPDMAEVKRLGAELQKRLRDMRETVDEGDQARQAADSANPAKTLPPSMVSKMAESVIASKEFLEEAQHAKLMEAQMTRNARGQKSLEWDEQCVDHRSGRIEEPEVNKSWCHLFSMFCDSSKR